MTVSEILAKCFTNGDQAKLHETIQQLRLNVAVQAGDLAGLRELVEGERRSVIEVNLLMHWL